MLVSVLKWCFLFESCHQRDTSFRPVQQDTSLTHEPLGSNPFEKTPSWEFVFHWMNLVKTQPIMVSAHIPSFCSQYLCEQTFRARKIQSGDCQSLPGVAGVCVTQVHISVTRRKISATLFVQASGLNLQSFGIRLLYPLAFGYAPHLRVLCWGSINFPQAGDLTLHFFLP